MRRTKIIATLGPATDAPGVLPALLEAGVDVVRVNFSHGDHAAQEQRIRAVREAAAAAGRHIGILGDLQGPKIRIQRFRDGAVSLREGQAFVLDPDLPPDAGDEHGVGVAYEALADDVAPGDTLLLDDGQIVLGVVSVSGRRITCTVEVGGELSDNKGINRQGGGLSAPALTDKDREDIELAARLQIEWLAVSFVRGADDIEEARALLRDAGGEGLIVAKIERAEAIEHLDEIILAADAVMVARGDLAVEVGYAGLTGLQKRIIRETRHRHKVSITATQMMESMISKPQPTRAEVSDVANAVMDGTDAVMLSAESAVGKYPVKAVATMSEICIGAETYHKMVAPMSRHRMDDRFARVDEAIAMAAMYTANHLDVEAIIALTESGSTALWMSRIRSDIPIFALTRHSQTLCRVSLYRGVYPVAFDIVHTDANHVYQDVFTRLLDMRLVNEGDLVIVTKGDLEGVSGGTNGMKILRVTGQ
ncbi:MAG: pyruvate kinase [Gammaproteobacteria bacterium]|nr:MAG: pyruvate kinase [Gammaproteobacteria bacterium]